MYGEVVEGIDAHRFESALSDLKAERGAQQDIELDANDLRELIGTYKQIYEEETGSPFPQDAREQLSRAVKAVFESWNTPRAQVYRRAHRIPDDLGTAVNVVQMVFGNKGAASGTGRHLHPRPVDGRDGALRRVPRGRPGRGRGRRDPHAGADRGDAEAAAGGLRPAARDDAPPRGALPRHAGHRVHRRGRPALPAADALGQAHGGGGAQGSGRNDGGGPDLTRGGGGPDRPRPARPAPAPEDRPDHGARRRRARA